jgi:hypothetical protein
MSRVHAPEGNVTLAAPASGELSVSASAVHGPEMLLDVHDRKYRPCAPIASTISTCWFDPSTLYTLDASKSRYLSEFCAAMTGSFMPFGKLPTGVCDR